MLISCDKLITTLNYIYHLNLTAVLKTQLLNKMVEYTINKRIKIATYFEFMNYMC